MAAFSPILPLLALGSLGGVVVSGGATLFLQNSIARNMHPDIPVTASAYNNWFARLQGKPETNHTLGGFVAFAAVAGTITVGGRVCAQPLLKALRKKFIFYPGTNVPRRINSFGGFLYDLCPDVVVNTLPLIPALPIGIVFKVWADGPGRFKDWSLQYNPYDSLSQQREEIYGRPTLPSYPLRKVTNGDLHVARGLWESAEITTEQKLKEYQLLLPNTTNH